MSLEEFFSNKKPIIGMLHLDYLAGQKEEYRGFEYVLSRAFVDLYNLQDGGIDGILIENWKEYTTRPEADPINVESMLEISKELAKRAEVPPGINVLNNDYKAAFRIAKEISAAFVQLDVFVDKVRTESDFNVYTAQNPFDVIVDPKDVIRHKPENIALFAFVQPKHYILSKKDKPIELSAKQAVENKADAIIVTGEKTGIAPSIEKIKKVKKAAGSIPVGIGSGFSRQNAGLYLQEVDFAIVGTDIKYEGKTDNPVDIERVKKLNRIKNDFLETLIL